MGALLLEKRLATIDYLQIMEMHKTNEYAKALEDFVDFIGLFDEPKTEVMGDYHAPY